MNNPFIKLYRIIRFTLLGNKINDKGQNNQISIKQSYVKNVVFNITGNNNIIEVHPDARLSNLTFTIKGHNCLIRIAERVVIKKGLVWLSNRNNRLIIGKRTTMEDVHLAVGDNDTSMEFGEYCMLAYDIELRTSDAHSIIDNSSGKRINYGKNIVVEDQVWIAAHSIILKGSTLGKGSVIAAGSIVSAQVEPNSLYGGVMAKKLKDNISWNRRKIQREEEA